MRITCPSCSSSFEIPSELLGKKGRALKCASCGHSWYQAAQVEAMDLASIMGEDYAAKAKAAAGPQMRNEVRPAGQAAPPGQKGAPKAPPGAAPVPPGATSMMNRNQAGQAPGQPAAPLGQRAPQQPQMQQAGIGAPKSRPVAQAAALSGQSMRGDNRAAAPGQGAVSWMNSPGAQGAPGAPGAAPGVPGAPGAAPGVPGAPGAPGAAPGAPGASGAPGQSMRTDEANKAPGQAAVSWMKNEEAGAGGAPGQSMRNPDTAGGPGEEAVSWMESGGAGGAPGQGPGAEEGRSGKPEAKLVDGEGREKKPDAELVDGEGREKKPDAELVAGEKSEEGASGGPGAPKDPDDDELVDPDADRPDFGSVDDEDSDGEDEDDDLSDDDEGEDEERASAAGVARGARQKRRKPIDPAYVTASIMGAAVLSLVLMIWFGRGLLMDLWPSFAGFYDSVGMEAEQPGGGLSIAESGKRLMRVGGVETLVVRGFVSNVSDVAKPVPGLRLELYDQREEAIQDSTGSTATALLDPGGTVEFELRMELPQLDVAQGYRIVWDND